MQTSLFGSLMTAPAEPEAPLTPKLLKTLLSEVVFTVVDVETTGLSAKKNSLTEVCAIQFKNGQEIGKFSTLIKPAEPISEEVEGITGISNDMVQNAPPLVNVLKDLCDFIGTSPLVVGHNVGFDIRFLSEKLQQSGMSNMAPRFTLERAFCTKTLGVKAVPGLPSYEGIVVATACGVINPNPHRAENDVRMSGEILFAIIRKLQEQDPALKTVADLLAYQGPLK